MTALGIPISFLGGLVIASAFGVTMNMVSMFAFIVVLGMIVDDHPLSQVAEELNRRDYRTRSGRPWTQTAIFNLLPRIIDAGPRIFESEGWAAQRKQRSLRVI